MKKVISALLIALLMLCMAVPALAAGNPSRENPLLPQPLVKSDLFGDKGSIEIYDDWDKDETEWDIEYIVPPEELILRFYTHMSESGVEGYRKLLDAEKISNVCPDFEETLKAMYPDADPDKMVVRDIFEFELLKGSLSALEKDEMNFVIIAFDYKIREGDTFMALQYVDGQWRAVDPDSVRVMDGLVAFRLRDTGALAFLLEDVSAQTLAKTGQVLWPIPVLIVVGLGLFTVGWIKRRKHG